MSLENPSAKQSWADLASLDDSRDGINLFMKHALSMQNMEGEEKSSEDKAPLSPVRENKPVVNAWQVKDDKLKLPVENQNPVQTVKAKWSDMGDSPWKAILVGESRNQTSSKKIQALNRKRLACDISTTPTNRTEKKAGVNKEEMQRIAKESSGTSRTLCFGQNTEATKPSTGNAWGVAEGSRNQGDQKKTRTQSQTTMKSWASLLKSDEPDTQHQGIEITDQCETNGSPAVPCNSKGFPIQPVEELTEGRIEKRQRQIDIGKSTNGYKRYVSMVPKGERRALRKKKTGLICPNTPEKAEKISKRAWDAQVRRWRRALHEWDPPGADAADASTAGQDDEESKGIPSTKLASGSHAASPIVKEGRISALKVLSSTVTPIRSSTSEQIKVEKKEPEENMEDDCVQPPKVVRVSNAVLKSV